MEEGSGNGASLIKLIWALLGGGVQIMLGTRDWGQSVPSVKDQGSHVLASEYGA